MAVQEPRRPKAGGGAQENDSYCASLKRQVLVHDLEGRPFPKLRSRRRQGVLPKPFVGRVSALGNTPVSRRKLRGNMLWRELITVCENT